MSGVEAMVLRHAGQIDRPRLELEQREPPAPGPGELRLRLAACAVCRTDLQITEGDLPAHARPVVPGHQAVGRVEAIGPDVAGWQVGDRAGVGWLAGVDGTCNECRAGRENLCPNATFTGYDRDGGYEEALIARGDFCFPIPDAFEDLDAAPLLCGGVIGFRSLRISGIAPGGRLGLYGFGASALLTLQVALHWGCEVYVVTRSAGEQARASEMGATWAGDYEQPLPVALDAAVTFAPVGSVVIAALRSLAPGGTVAINAIHLDHVPEFDYDLLWRERGLRSVANYTRQDARDFLALAAEIPIKPEIQPFPLAAANEALRELKAGGLQGPAVLTIRS
jgi:propanol-preferring alcohol dehydrogenase